MSSSLLRKKLSFRRKKKKGGAAPFFLSKSTSESTASCSPPPLGSFPISPPRPECSNQKEEQENVSQWSLAHHLKQQQQQQENQVKRSHDETKSYASQPHPNNNNNKTDLQDSPRSLWNQATALDTAGNTLLEQGHYTRARKTYERALALKQSSLHHSSKKKNPDLLASVATSINNIGYLRQRAGASPQDCMAAYQDALVLKQDILGTQSLSVGKTLNNIGSVYYSQHDYPNALVSYREARNIMEYNLGKNHLDVATVYSNMGDVYMATGQRPEALSHLKRALEIRWNHLEEHSPKIRRLLEKISMVEMNTIHHGNHGFTEEYENDRLLWEGDEHGGVQEELHLLSSQVEADIQQVGDMRRKMALDMVKDKLRILKGMRQIELHNDEDDNGSARSAPSPPESSVHVHGCSSKTPPPLSPMERQDALSSVKERLAKLREQKSLRSLMGEEQDSNSHHDEHDDAEMERQLGIGHLLEFPKLNLDSVLGDD